MVELYLVNLTENVKKNKITQLKELLKVETKPRRSATEPIELPTKSELLQDVLVDPSDVRKGLKSTRATIDEGFKTERLVHDPFEKKKEQERMLKEGEIAERMLQEGEIAVPSGSQVLPPGFEGVAAPVSDPMEQPFIFRDQNENILRGDNIEMENALDNIHRRQLEREHIRNLSLREANLLRHREIPVQHLRMEAEMSGRRRAPPSMRDETISPTRTAAPPRSRIASTPTRPNIPPPTEAPSAFTTRAPRQQLDQFIDLVRSTERMKAANVKQSELKQMLVDLLPDDRKRDQFILDLPDDVLRKVGITKDEVSLLERKRGVKRKQPGEEVRPQISLTSKQQELLDKELAALAGKQKKRATKKKAIKPQAVKPPAEGGLKMLHTASMKKLGRKPLISPALAKRLPKNKKKIDQILNNALSDDRKKFVIRATDLNI